MSALAKDWPQAARLLGAAGALERASDRSDGRLVRPLEEQRAQARSALEFEAYDTALKEGERMTYAEAIRLASAVLQSLAETGPDGSILLIATGRK